jgi:hypothetical protein
MNELSKRGISCACVSGEQACPDKSGVPYGKYSFVFANPESIITKLRKKTQTFFLKKNQTFLGKKHKLFFEKKTQAFFGKKNTNFF